MSANWSSGKKPKKNWQDMDVDEWLDENAHINGPFVDQNLAVELPLGFYRVDMDFGTFIEIRPADEYWGEPTYDEAAGDDRFDGPPGVVVLDDKDGHSQHALKVLLPLSAQAGDRFVLVKEAKSGKSWHGRILDMDEKFDTQTAEGNILLAREQRVTKHVAKQEQKQEVTA